MSRTRRADKSWATAYQTEQRQPGGHVGGGQWTAGSINPLAAAAQRNQQAIARHEAMLRGIQPGGPAQAAKPGGTGPDAEDQAEAAEAKQLMQQAAALEREIGRLRSQLQAVNNEISYRAGQAAGASSGQRQSNVAAASQQAAAGAAAGASSGSSGSSGSVWGMSNSQLASRRADLRGDIKQLKKQRSALLKRARKLLRDSRKASRSEITKSEQRDDLSERILLALATGSRVRLGAGELRDLLG